MSGYCFYTRNECVLVCFLNSSHLQVLYRMVRLTKVCCNWFSVFFILMCERFLMQLDWLQHLVKMLCMASGILCKLGESWAVINQVQNMLVLCALKSRIYCIEEFSAHLILQVWIRDSTLALLFASRSPWYSFNGIFLAVYSRPATLDKKGAFRLFLTLTLSGLPESGWWSAVEYHVDPTPSGEWDQSGTIVQGLCALSLPSWKPPLHSLQNLTLHDRDRLLTI